jgi:RNA polymerase sigma-70 factor (ECF subfamily)
MPRTQPFEESTLLTLLAEDSEYAFQLLFDRYHSLVYRMAMMYVKSPALAEDIVQDVFLKLWFQRKSLLQLSSLESWICILTRNFTINCLKKLAHEWTARGKWANEHAAFESDTDYRIRNAQYKALLSQAIEQLPPQQQKVYQLAKEKGLSYEAIGSQLSLSPLTVKTHMSRALAAIRAYLQQHDREFLILFTISLISF